MEEEFFAGLLLRIVSSDIAYRLHQLKDMGFTKEQVLEAARRQIEKEFEEQ